MELKIRKVKVEDIAALVELTQQWGYETTALEIAANLSRIEQANNAEVFIAEADDKVVGRIFVREHLTLGTSPFAEIHDLVVHTEYRKRGIGRLLIEAVKDWSREKGIGLVRLRTNVNREEANVFYPHIGFNLQKVQNVYDINL